MNYGAFLLATYNLSLLLLFVNLGGFCAALGKRFLKERRHRICPLRVIGDSIIFPSFQVGLGGIA